MSDNPVSLLVGDYESTEDAKADLQKLKQLHLDGTEGTSVLFALTSCGSPALVYLPKVKAFDAALSEPSRADLS